MAEAEVGRVGSGACVLEASPAAAAGPGPAPGREERNARAPRRRRQLFLSRPPAATLSASGRAGEQLCSWRDTRVSVGAEEKARASAAGGE